MEVAIGCCAVCLCTVVVIVSIANTVLASVFMSIGAEGAAGCWIGLMGEVAIVVGVLAIVLLPWCFW